MAKKRDLLDDFIDIQHDWNAVSHSTDGIKDSLTSSLMGEESNRKVFDPQDYKERPRANSLYCVNVSSKNPDACDRCLTVCPSDAITIKGASVKVSNDCRRCGLCVGVCPTEVFSTRNSAKVLYDKIARAASTYEECYVTCTRALKRNPKPNEILLPCVGLMSQELWFSLLTDYGNISVFLPLGICDRCRTTTGEEAYSDAIAQAEEWTGESVGLEVEKSALNHEESRAYKRSQFMSSVATAGTRIITKGNKPLAGAAAVAKRVQDHTHKLTELQQSLEKAVGAQTANSRRRILLQKRKLMIAAMTEYPELAKGVQMEVPEWDASRCTMCGDCATACPVHACQLDKDGHFSVEPAYCVNCGGCVAACADGALKMVSRTADDLVIIDEEKIRQKAEAQAKIDKAKAKSKKTFEKGLDVLEHMADADEKKAKPKKKAAPQLEKVAGEAEVPATAGEATQE